MASDCRSEAGADFILNMNTNVYIECVCSSLGRVDSSWKLYSNMDGKLVDYRKKKEYLNSRFTSSIRDKVTFYNRHCPKSIPRNSPYIIFLSPGSLTYEWFAGEYGLELTDILFGRGIPTITLDNTTDKIIRTGYTHIDTFKKHNGAEINSNLFADRNYACISGILLATAPCEKYTKNNTFLFKNPSACTPLQPVFQDLVYWDLVRKDLYASLNIEALHLDAQ